MHSLWSRKSQSYRTVKSSLCDFHCWVRYFSSSRVSGWRMGLKHYILSGCHPAPFWGWNLLLFSVQSSPLVDLRLTADTLNATDCILPVHCETPLMSWSLVFPHKGFFSWPFTGEQQRVWSKSIQSFLWVAGGVFKTCGGLCSSAFSFRAKHKEHYHTWNYLTVTSAN